MTGPALSNYLADLAERIGAHVGRYRRSTLTAAEAALEAGALLVEARGECRHGEWLPFLARAGMADRTARNWMRLARSGLDAPNIVAAGGVRAALLAITNPKAIAIVERQMSEAAREADIGHVADLPAPAASPAPAPNPAISGPREVPDPHGARPVAPPAGCIPDRSSLQGAQPADSASAADPALERGPALYEAALTDHEPRPGGDVAATSRDPSRGMTLYAWRRSMGDCTACGAPSGGAARCSGCAATLNRKRRSRSRIAGELVTRIEAAAASGAGLTLTAADVARLAGGGPVPERCGRTVDWVG